MWNVEYGVHPYGKDERLVWLGASWLLVVQDIGNLVKDSCHVTEDGYDKKCFKFSTISEAEARLTKLAKTRILPLTTDPLIHLEHL